MLIRRINVSLYTKMDGYCSGPLVFAYCLGTQPPTACIPYRHRLLYSGQAFSDHLIVFMGHFRDYLGV